MEELAQVVYDEDQRRLARWNLKRAMHDRRIAEIEKALIAGEECHLYPMELEHARHTLLEARKADGAYRLEKALSSGDIELIRQSIDQAAELGVNQSKLQAAEKVLEDVKKHEDAKMLLREAERSHDIALLRQALTDAQDLGLDPEELAQCRETLDRWERKACAEERLQTAMQGTSVADLKESIALASAAGLPRREMDLARKALKCQEQKAAARILLKDARLGKKASAQERIQDLRDAVKDAKATGLSEDEMASAVAVLDQLMMEVLARRDLAEAMASATIDALKPAIENARAAGIDAEELIPAQTQLENAYKPTARAKLKEAVLTRDIPSILAAIEQGKAVGLSVMAIAEASEIVKEEELKAQLRRRLAQLYGSQNLQELKAAINLGQINGLKEELNDARRQVQELETQEALCERIERAIQSREIPQIKAVLTEAEELLQRVLTPCIPKERIEEAEKALRVEILEAARSMVQDAVKRCSGQAALRRDSNAPEAAAFDPKAALRERRRSQANFEAALEAVGVESRPGSSQEPVNPRASGLGKRRTSALGGGQQLAGGQSAQGDEYFMRIQTLKTAIRGAEALGLDDAEIQPAREVMAEQQKKLHACQALAQGKKLRSLHHIQQALEIAQEAGLSHMEMKTALDAQKEIKKMDEAAERLETAMDLRDLEKLRWAIKWAKEAKVDEDDVADAEEVLQELEKRQKAFAQLDAAKESESIDQLVEALKQAEEILEEEELEPYEEALLEQRQRFASNALEEAVKSRSIPALKEAMKLAELAEMEAEDLVLASHRVLAEEMLLRALKGLNISDDLRRALQEAQEWQPEVERLPGALRDKDPTELAIALRLSEMKGSPSDLQNYKIMAEELLAQAKEGILPSQILRTAIEEADEWAPEFPQLKGAKKRLALEDQKDAARAKLRGALKSSDPAEIALAIRSGRESQLEDWEMNPAERALDSIRRDMMNALARAVD